MAAQKVSDEAMQADFDASMTLKDIAEKYDLSLMTVYKRKKSLGPKSDSGDEKQAGDAKDPKKPRDLLYIIPPRIRPFSLQAGDFIRAAEAEISQTMNTYRVIEIYGNHFVCEKVSGKGRWKTSFLKIDWRLGLIGRGK